MNSRSPDKLYEWMNTEGFPTDVIQSFKDNEMDTESLEALLTTTQGPDCLKELIPKLGVRLRVFQRIKLFCSSSFSSHMQPEPRIELQAVLDDPSGRHDPYCDDVVTDSSYKESSVSTYSSASDQEIAQLRKEVSSLCKEKKSLELELETLHKDHANLSTSKKGAASILEPVDPKLKLLATASPATSVASHNSSSYKELPNPFPIPTFRHSTEMHLQKKGGIQDSDRKYIVQTLATILMTYRSRPSLKDCQLVSKSLHKKFKGLGDESSEDAWKWFIYTRSQNINRKSSDDDSLPRKKQKLDTRKHEYPSIPEGADDETSDQRNLTNLRDEWARTDCDPEKVKELLMRTHRVRRMKILNEENSTAFATLQTYPMLKRSSYAKLEFELTMQRPNLKDHFDEEFLLWSKATISYCKKSCKKTTAIQKLVKDVDVECDDQLLIKAVRCLGLLLITTKTKETAGTIPYFMRFVPNETPAEQAPEPGNFQPHVVVIAHDEYDQYFVAVERKLCMECTDLATALFNLLGCHYILNLSYHQKLHDIMRFLQEKVAGIPSSTCVKSKSPVSTTHIGGISSEYAAMNRSESESDSDDNE